jgi:hypothetical protein
MINAVSGAAEKVPAPTRLTGEETLKRRDEPQPSAVAAAETNSVVVEISREGARRAQAKAAAPTVPAQPSQEAAQQPASATMQQVTAAAEQAGVRASQDGTAEASEFDEADANQDGTVNVLERRAFDFMHPTLARYPGSADEQTPRTVAAELKAYEAVARSGRNL